jgi:NAD(P)-dependent dehydrogenase (short-subunit alcohol dehydrogenase family)
MTLGGQVALVTGSSKGIGRAIAMAYAREGARLVITSRNEKESEAVAAEIEASGGAAVAIPADLTRSDERQALLRRTLDAFGQVDILVNNAGRTAIAPSESLAEADWRQVLELDLHAYFLLCQMVAPSMLARRHGVIINVTSINGTVAFPQRAAYCVAKAGVNMLTKVLAIEWAERGIRVNALAPGYVETDLIRDLIARGMVDRVRLEGRTPVRRLATPEEVAEAAVFLASDASRYITGTVLTIDGGWTAYGYV